MNFKGVKRSGGGVESEWEDTELGKALSTGWGLEVSEKMWNTR